MARYDFIAGEAVKNSQNLVIPHMLTLAVFVRGLRFLKALYHVAAIVVDHGLHTKTGHYTALLCQPEHGKGTLLASGRLCDALPNSVQCASQVTMTPATMLCLNPLSNLFSFGKS